MKATLNSQVSNGRMLDKEQIACFTGVVSHNGELLEPVTVRCWMGRSSNASTVYASVWIGHKDFHTSGHGKAGGYGYCKKSSAVYDAFRSAGIEFDMRWAGAGESRVVQAVEAICRELGFETIHVVVS
jgi:hypothetical protein